MWGVTCDVEGRVVHPHGRRYACEHRCDPLTEARQRVEPGLDVGSQLGDAEASALVAQRCRLEEAQRADLQLRAARLRAQQGNVLGAERLGGHRAGARRADRVAALGLRFPRAAKELCDAGGQTLRAPTQLERGTGLHQFGVGQLAGQLGGVVEGVEQVVAVRQDQGGRRDTGALLLRGCDGAYEHAVHDRGEHLRA